MTFREIILEGVKERRVFRFDKLVKGRWWNYSTKHMYTLDIKSDKIIISFGKNLIGKLKEISSIPYDLNTLEKEISKLEKTKEYSDIPVIDKIAWDEIEKYHKTIES